MRWFDAGLQVLIATGLGAALEIAIGHGGTLATNQSMAIVMNGLHYSLSNSTTDRVAMDPMKDPEACTRDAAIMAKLGINTIYVENINPTLNHDDCFSIFNSVGIYVVVMLGWGRSQGQEIYDDIYDEGNALTVFETIDAVKDYENLLGLDVAAFPLSILFMGRYESFSISQKLLRALIRDTKEYTDRHCSRPILVGTSIAYDYIGGLSSGGIFKHLTCDLSHDDKYSRPDFVGFVSAVILPHNVDQEDLDKQVSSQIRVLRAIAEELDDSPIPIWMSNYGVLTDMLRNVSDTFALYETFGPIRRPSGALNGGIRGRWVNAGPQAELWNYGLVRLDTSGKIQLTESFGSLRKLFDGYNTESWRGAYRVQAEVLNQKECHRDILGNVTREAHEVSASTFWTMATDWNLPERPTEIASLVTNGAPSASRGQMVDVTITTFTHTIMDTDGNIVTDIVLRPSSSESRSTMESTFSAPTDTGSTSGKDKDSLSTSQRAGLGVGVGVSFLMIAGGLLFFFLRRRRMSNAAVNGGQPGPIGMGHEKAELPGHSEAHGPNMYAAIDAEKVSREVSKPHYSEMEATMNCPPVELPAFDTTQELETTTKTNTTRET